MNRKPTPEELLKQMFSDENLRAFAAFFNEDFQPAKKPAAADATKPAPPPQSPRQPRQ